MDQAAAMAENNIDAVQVNVVKNKQHEIKLMQKRLNESKLLTKHQMQQMKKSKLQ